MGLDPIFRICGTKSGISLTDACCLLQGYLHDGRRLVEPFCGSASVTLASTPEKCMLADLQPHCILTLQVLRSKPFGILAAFDAIRETYLAAPTAKTFYELREKQPKTAVDRAAWFLFIVHACFNWLWRVNRVGKCNTTWGGDAGVKRIKRAVPRGNALAVANWLNAEGRDIEHADCLATIARTGDGDVVYVDPPYVGQFDSYNAIKFKKAGHDAMYVALRAAWQRGAKVILQCNADPALAARYADFCRVFLRGVYRRVAGEKARQSAINDWEMLLVSQELQCSFLHQTPEDKLLCYGLTEAIWNNGSQTWETWIPSQPHNLLLFPEGTDQIQTPQTQKLSE